MGLRTLFVGSVLAGLLVPALAAGLAIGPEKESRSGKGKRRWATCDLTVGNKTPFRVLIHVDGVYWGWVSAQQTFTFKGIPEGDIIVYGDTQYAEFFWGPQNMKCRGTASWDLSF